MAHMKMLALPVGDHNLISVFKSAALFLDDLDISALRGQSITFHGLHSDSIRLSHDNRVARRVNSFRGICFSSRPICIFERIYVRIADVVSASQSVGREVHILIASVLRIVFHNSTKFERKVLFN